MWEAFEHAAHYELDNLDGDLRREPTRPAWRDDGRLGGRELRRPRRGVRMACDRDRRPRRRGGGSRVRGGDRDQGQADGRRRADGEGQGREGCREQERVPRQATRRPGRGHRRARRRARHPNRGSEAGAGRAAPLPDRPARAPTLRARQRGGHTPGVRRGSRRRRAPHGATSSRSTARCRTRPSPRYSARLTPTGSSRCTSRSNSSWRRQSGSRCAAGGRSRRPSRPSSSRAYDFVRMAAISRASFVLCGSHAGVSIGEDGPSQMALEDFAALRAVHGSTVLHPCDANQTAKLVAALAEIEKASRTCGR